MSASLPRKGRVVADPPATNAADDDPTGVALLATPGAGFQDAVKAVLRPGTCVIVHGAHASADGEVCLVEVAGDPHRGERGWVPKRAIEF
ncbi:MAG TPA: hypothetical protein VEI02_15715 [Planctomycetota bacterium]|nr:hypothetical protein [Planctomycetota bacterium]